MPVKLKNKAEFLAQFQEYYTIGPPLEDPEAATRAVFKLLFHKVSEGEINDIKSMIPEEIRELLPRKM